MSGPFVPPGILPSADALTRDALLSRKAQVYARHPVQSSVRTLGSCLPSIGPEGLDGHGFQAAESYYRAGAQGLRLSEIPQLPQSLIQLSRLGSVDRAGRLSLRRWIEAEGRSYDESAFLARWEAQGRLGGAEHQVFYDENSGRWFKRLYACVNGSTLGDYFDRMLLHAAVFPETAYRLEGFTINPKSRFLAPVVSQPHVAVDIGQPPVSKEETDSLMADLGFVPVRLRYDGVVDDGYRAYHLPCPGILAHDLHDENVVRMDPGGELAVIDPYLSLDRKGTWAAMKPAEIGIDGLADDPVS